MFIHFDLARFCSDTQRPELPKKFPQLHYVTPKCENLKKNYVFCFDIYLIKNTYNFCARKKTNDQKR